MSYRGSLKNCITLAVEQLHSGNYPMMAIIHNPRGKYYTLYSEQELEELTAEDKPAHMRLVWRGTWLELRSFASQPPPDLFGGTENAH